MPVSTPRAAALPTHCRTAAPAGTLLAPSRRPRLLAAVALAAVLIAPVPVLLGTGHAAPAAVATGPAGGASLSGASPAGGTPLLPVARVVAGGAAVTGRDGTVWSPDGGIADGGHTWTSTGPIAGTDDPALFRGERYGLRGYHLPVPGAGRYRVTLREAELYWSRPGQRVFDVAAEGAPVLSGVDIVSSVGPAAALTRSFDVIVSDGVLDLAFTARTDAAKVASLEVDRLGGPGSATPAITRLVAGATPVVDAAGDVWSPDAGVADGGSTWTSGSPITGTADPALFRGERYGLRGYHLPVPAAGRYRVVLRAAELYWTAPGRRVFALTAEGSTALPVIDLAASAGAAGAVIRSADVTVTDGVLDLGFTAQADLPKIGSLEVLQLDPPATATATAVPVLVPGPSPSAPAAPTPAAPPAPPAPPAPELVSVLSFGAVGDGVTDDTAALQRALDAAHPGVGVLVPVGRVFAHAAVLRITVAGTRVTGGGVLLATDEARSSMWVQADRVTLDGGLTLRTARTTRRWEAWEQMGLRLDGHAGAVLRGITVDGSAAAGIYVGGADHFVLDHVTVRGTRADGIHLTGGSHDGTVISPTVVGSGDDGVAVVSYRSDGPPCHDITVSSPQVLGTTWGRGLSVVGGTDITYTDVDVERTDAAAVYLASEGSPWNTWAPVRVSVTGGRLVQANLDTGIDHGAVLVLAGGDGAPAPDGVTVRGLAITSTRAGASRSVGVISYGAGPRGVLLDALAITGGPRDPVNGNTPAYSSTGISHDGAALPDHHG